MFTYFIWKASTDFDYKTTDFKKISIYSTLTLFTLATIWLDILTLPFQTAGVAIFLITKIIKKNKGEQKCQN